MLVTMAPGTAASGRAVFAAHCAICHQATGAGIPGQYPPLANSVGKYVQTAKGRAYLVHVVSFGMNGPIAVHGATYNGLMQSWKDLSNEDIAEVLDYVLTSFNSTLLPRDFKPFTAAEVKRYRSAKLSLAGVHRERDRLMKALTAAGVAAAAGQGL